MASFRYKAVTSGGALTTGLLDAACEADAVAQIRALGHLPIAATPSGPSGWRNLRARFAPQSRNHSRRAVAVAVQELAVLLQARLPLDRALAILVELDETKRLRAPLAEVLAHVRGGKNLADSFESAGVFPKAIVAMVRAGEMGGNLEVTLARLADYLNRATAVRETVISALIYPAILLCTAGLSVVFILVFVLPEFAPLFSQAGKTLPRSTQIVMAVSAFVTDWWWLIAALALAAFLLLRRALGTEAFRHAWDAAILRLPVVGDLVRKSDVERFARMLGTLLSSGVALPQALLIVRGALANSVIAQAVGDTAAGLKEGEQLASRLRRTGRFPSLALDLIRVGEETGTLDDMLLRQAELYEREVRHAIDRLLALLVPVLTIAMGALVAGLIASILVAILSINDLAL